jgi:hypothetical protein
MPLNASRKLQNFATRARGPFRGGWSHSPPEGEGGDVDYRVFCYVGHLDKYGGYQNEFLINRAFQKVARARVVSREEPDRGPTAGLRGTSRTGKPLGDTHFASGRGVIPPEGVR